MFKPDETDWTWGHLILRVCVGSSWECSAPKWYYHSSQRKLKFCEMDLWRKGRNVQHIWLHGGDHFTLKTYVLKVKHTPWEAVVCQRLIAKYARPWEVLPELLHTHCTQCVLENRLRGWWQPFQDANMASPRQLCAVPWQQYDTKENILLQERSYVQCVLVFFF